MLNWDYDIPKNWQPKTDTEWEWYLARLIDYGLDENQRLDIVMLRKYLPRLRIDPNRRAFIELLLKHYE